MLGKRSRNTNKTLEELINDCTIEDKEKALEQNEQLQESPTVIGMTIQNMGKKRVKFNQKNDKIHEFEV